MVYTDDLEGNCIVDRIDLISSDKQRAIMSAFSFIKGLCPKNYIEIS